ncbi:hypothetical protein G7059_03170 [Erysipelothrix sp. HDW6A]|uniref:hypothetical protein n=1 Tax=Erysipelothrix sp. HDW6A TaxID=2714928 RepID=UPI001408EE3A|nr:hypothetical protein [Erysipelothrix sp. HDW6A]QIK56921.1 hypothetical protein G7059_03170 [Erysipelothrix sp. HDW6A]
MGASSIASSFTSLAMNVGFAIPEGATEITWLKTSPIIWSIFEMFNKNYILVIVLVVLMGISFYVLKKYYSKPIDNEVV